MHYLFICILFQRVINNMNNEAQDRCADETIQGQPPHVPNDDEFLQMGQQQLPDILQHVCYAFFHFSFIFLSLFFCRKIMLINFLMFFFKMRKGAPTSLLASEACQQKSASFDHIFSGSALPNNRIISIDQPSVIIFFTTKCIVLNLHIYSTIL